MEIMKKFALIVGLAVSAMSWAQQQAQKTAQVQHQAPRPTRAQQEWMDMERYAFAHFSINTFTDQEWGYGDESPALFTPDSLDCRQWARVCKEAGLTGIILTAKHHCGFCLWPSVYTHFSVKNSPWRDGQGDVMRELREACDEYGLKLGFYLSPWDRNRTDYGEPSYVDYFRNQLRELLTQYGDIFEVWFDGANGGDGYYGGANERRSIDRTSYYGWPETIEIVRGLQPDCIIWNCVGPDARWCGNERGVIGTTNWSRYDYHANTPGAEDTVTLNCGDPEGPDFIVAEADVSIRPGWFYHQSENDQVKSVEELWEIYLSSVGRGGTLLLNFPIDVQGRIHQADADAAIALNRRIERTFACDLAAEAVVIELDNSLVLDLQQPADFDVIVLKENLTQGQTVASFSVMADGAEVVNGTTIGHKRILEIEPVSASKIEVSYSTLDAASKPIAVSLYQKCDN